VGIIGSEQDKNIEWTMIFEEILQTFYQLASVHYKLNINNYYLRGLYTRMHCLCFTNAQHTKHGFVRDNYATFLFIVEFITEIPNHIRKNLICVVVFLFFFHSTYP